MIRVLGAWLLIFALAGGGVTTGLAQSGEPSASPGSGRMLPAGVATQAIELAAQVGEISHSTMISRTKKEKRIATAVRVAVVAATAYKQDPDEILGIGLKLAAAAARAAPPFTEVIANAVSFAPAVARIDGAASRVRTAAFAAAKTPEIRREKRAPIGEYARTAEPPSANPEIAAAETPLRPTETEMTTKPVASELATQSTDVDNAAGTSLTSPAATSRSKFSLGSNLVFNLTADLGAQYNDNIFWTQTDKVADTLISVAPSAEYRFGQDSLAHGGITYKETIARYVNNSAPQVDLGTGSADFGYADDKLTLTGSASYNQLDQNNPDILAQQRRTLLRSNLFAVGGSAEAQLTGKISSKLGVDYNHTDYLTTGLINTQHEDVPFSLYFVTTPKLALSTGVTYSVDRPDGGGPTGKDLYYNVGLRGSLTPKLSTEFSVGEQTREVADTPSQHLLGFNGSFTYEVTPKTNSVLVLSRGFSVSALGESLVNGSYQVGLTTDLTPQWQVGTSLTYRTVDYGTAVFTLDNFPEAIRRKDDYWEGGLQITYLYSQHLSASANYTYRTNQSTVPAVDFSDNILGLMLSLRY